MLGLVEAINQATAIQKDNPKKILCGSLALILAGRIKRTTVGDLDFVAKEGTIKRDRRNKSSKSDVDGIGYTHSNIDKPFEHCLFFVPNLKREHTKYAGLVIQDIEQMLYWKRHFGRIKDYKDLDEEPLENVTPTLDSFMLGVPARDYQSKNNETHNFRQSSSIDY